MPQIRASCRIEVMPLLLFYKFMINLTSKEIEAVYKAGYLMVLADGKVFPEEIATVEDAMTKVGVANLDELEAIKENAQKMSEAECYGLLAFLDIEQKRFVSSMLGAISSSDGDIDDAELELWRDICNKCDLPRMNNRQAINLFQNF